MRTWMTQSVVQRANFRWIETDMNDYYPVSIYKSTTGQYTDDEIDDPCDPWSNIVEIPVPKDLILQWFRQEYNIDRDFDRLNKEFGYTEEDVDTDLRIWIYEESTCDETCELYDWLCKHNYFWKRLK